LPSTPRRSSSALADRAAPARQLRLDYPAAPLAAAIESAAHYGLCDLDRLERMILRNIATAYFVVPDERNDPEPDDEG